MRGIRTSSGHAASGLATDAGVRALSEGDLQGRPADIVPREGDVPSLALGILAAGALAATGADLAVAALPSAPGDRSTAGLPGSHQGSGMLFAQEGTGLPLTGDVIARVHQHLRTSATGSWSGPGLADLLGRGPCAEAQAWSGTLAGVRVRLAGRPGALLALHRSHTPAASSTVATLGRVAKLALRVPESLHAVAHSERRKLGQALHDTLAQTLTELVFATDALAGDAGDAPGRQLVCKTRDLAARALRETRAVLTSALALEDYPLPASIADLAIDLRHAGIDVRFHEPEDLGVLPPHVDRCLRYAAREALVNIRRHANADRVDITLQSLGRGILLAVTDHASGSSRRSGEGARPWSGLGLRLLRESVEEIGGSVDLTPAPPPGTGTCLSVALPIPGGARAARRARDQDRTNAKLCS